MMRITIAILLALAPVDGLCEIRPATNAPQPLSPAESAATIRLPKGFRIDLVASEPLIADPTCVAFDEHLRLFVCELHGYNMEGHLDVVELNKTGVLDKQVRRLRWEFIGGEVADKASQLQYGVVKLLVDNDRDGVMDIAVVWADDLPPCYGIVPARNGVIVTCAPHIVYLGDENHDGNVDVREVLYTGFHIRELERGINNPQWGLDNWIYVGAGRHAGTITGPRLAEPVQLGNQDFRIKADGTAIEPVSGSVGTFGLAMNDVGDRFPCSGGEPAVYALPLPHRYLIRNPHVPTPRTNFSAANYAQGFRISQPHPWRVKRSQDPAWVKFYGTRETNSNYFSGGCGGLIYRAAAFPQQYQDNFFYCEPSLNLIHRCLLTRDGSGYKARRAPGEQQSEFLASTDQWFRPMNLRIGPDGAMYIVDMYREIIEDYSAIPRYLQQQYGLIKGSDRGRIWRLSHGGSSGEQFDSPMDFTTKQLVAATSHANPWWRTTAQRLLIERDATQAAGTLHTQLHQGETWQGRLHAMYTLDGLGQLHPDDVNRVFADPRYAVRLHALRLADRWLDEDDALLENLLGMIDDPDASVRLQVAMSLGESTDPRAADALASMASRYADQHWMSTAILSSSRQSAGPLLNRLLGGEELGRAVSLLIQPLAATLGAQRDDAQIQQVIDQLARHDIAAQRACLQGLLDGAVRNSKHLPVSQNDWQSLLQFLRSDSSELRILSASLAANLGLQATASFQQAMSDAAQQVLNSDISVEMRTEALLTLASDRSELFLSTASELLDAQQPLQLQEAVINALADVDDRRITDVIFSAWHALSPRLRSHAIQTVFSRKNRLPKLLEAIESEIVRRGDIGSSTRELLLTSKEKKIAAKSRELFDAPVADVADDALMHKYQLALSNSRDIALGKEVFLKHCLACHKLNDEGFDVGPPLGSVINRPDEAILADILSPNDKVDSEYASYIIVTNDGRTETGVLVSESATSVTLSKEKGEQIVVLRQDIDELRASDVSLMPSNLHEQITPQDAANLIAYLRTAFGSSQPTD